MDTISYSHIDGKACRLLALAVLHRAILDAVSPTTLVKNSSRPTELEHSQAKAFVDRRNEDFRVFCDIAGLNADQVFEAYINGKFTAENMGMYRIREQAA